MLKSLIKRPLRAAVAASLAVLVAGCSDSSVFSPDARAARNQIPVAGALTWLAPLGNGAANPATFDAQIVSRVEVCQWAANACVSLPVAAFSSTPATGEGLLTRNTTAGRYEAVFNLLNTKFTTRKTYRVRVLQGTTEIGGILVDVVRGRWALTRTDGTLAPLVPANTLNIQFHVAVVPPPLVKVNEVESNGGTPGDWVEFFNAGATAVDVSGFVFKDNDDTHIYAIPAGTVIAAGGYLVLDEAQFGFGLGGAESARLFDLNGTIVDSYTWAAHAQTTYGRCPNGTGNFITMTTVTKGAANDCTIPNTVKINEIESSGGTPGDWVELYNTGASPLDVSGFVFKDNDDRNAYIIPSNTVIAAGGYLVLEERQFVFGLGANETARIFDQGGALVDSYAWTAHAATTYGRCPNGTGAFVTMTTVTKGTANDCGVPNTITLNEAESSGGAPGDWAELLNTGALPVDISGYIFRDNDDTHTYVIPAGTIVAPGAYFLIEEAQMGFGLGSADAVRLFDTGGTLRDSYSWTAHATTTYGRCPNGTGAFTTTTTVTKGAANDCSVPNPVKVNEVESSGGTPGDWVELFNTGASAVDISGFIFRDNDDTHTYLIPAGTTIAAGGYWVLEEAAFGFGLGAAESARLYNAAGSIIDTYSWTAHATTTYGRCPNGTGAFVTMNTTTKGAANDCGATPPTPVVATWPGQDNVTTVDVAGTFSSNLSGLVFEGGSTDVLWAARNGPGSIYRMLFNGSAWVPDQNSGWASGKLTKYTDGTGEPDTEDVTFTTGSAAGMYIASERNNASSSVSRPSILRYDVSGTSTTLTATHEWLLTADLPVVAANSGLEAITWIPDSYLVSQGFFDVTAGQLYNPANYPNNGGGLFFVGLEGNGMVYVYALNHSNSSFTRIASFSTGFPSGVMALQFDRELGQLWATCDDTCGGLSNIYVIDATSGSLTLGRMKRTYTFARPASMPNINNEGFAFAPQSACVGGFKPAFWSDDASTGGNAIRRASIPCVKFP